MFVVSLLDDRMGVVSDCFMFWSLGDFYLMLAVSRGLNWRGGMILPKNRITAIFLEMTKRPDNVHMVFKYRQMKIVKY